MIIVLTTITVLSQATVMAQEDTVQMENTNIGLTKASYDPEFITYQQQQNNLVASLRSKELFSGDEAFRYSGIIPHPVGLMAEAPSLDTKSPETYPETFDLRDHDRVTPVKDQGSSGSCWTFATYASLESTLKQTGTYDFSENNMKNLLSSSYADGFDRLANSGGNYFMSTAYLARMSGPISEADDPYDPYSTLSSTDLEPVKFVNDVTILPQRENSTDNSWIKWALMNHGAIYSSICYDSNYYNANNSSYYYNAGTVTNHAITIVGWDDNYDLNNFDPKPADNGAFLIKNSWGTSWGDEGYFHISYEDTCIGRKNALFNATDMRNFVVYEHDPLGWTQTVTLSQPNFWVGNVFEAQERGELEVIGFYTPEVDMDYEAYIYSGNACNGSGLEQLLYSCNGTIPFAGYHTVEIDDTIILEDGQDFSIVINFTDKDSYANVAIENIIYSYSSQASAGPDESYYSTGGVTWTDLNSSLPDTNFCIKAFVEPFYPTILTHEPADNIFSSYEDENITFKVTLDRTANVAWYLNGANMQENSTLTEANYSVLSPQAGAHNITAIAYNQWGNDQQTWHLTVYDWNPWNDPGSLGNTTITTEELQEAVYHWVNDLDAPVTNATVTTERLQQLIHEWVNS